MFTILLLLLVLVAVLLRLLSNLLVPPAQFPADSPNIQVPTSPSCRKLGYEEHDKVSAAVKDSESLMRGHQHSPSSSNIQIPTSPSTPKSGSEEHDKVSAADFTDTKKSPPSSSNIQMPTSPSTPKFGSEEHDKVSAPDSTDTKRSSPSSSVPKFEHDVFLSFRGEDTRNCFTDHLYHALKRKGIYTFRDTENLKRGNSISPYLSKAIEESQIAVIILSANYANSTWCLDELARIVNRQQLTGLKIFPVFYHVDTAQVRKQLGSFGTAFCKHEEAFKDNMNKVIKWREALTLVASTAGWDVKGRAESEVIEEIATDIFNISNNMCSSDWKDLVGMKARMETMESYLDMGLNDVRTIGIWGMGGIGKTTLAKAVFNKKHSKFDCSAFVGEVRQESGKVNGEVELQKLLCKKLQLDSDANIQNDFMGKDLLRKRLRHKKVLIILDDVDDKEQIDSLADEGWLGSGSRVIITTRDKHTLTLCGVPEDKTYEVEKLTDNEAIQLFCQKAFKENQNHAPPDEYKDLSNNFFKYASGLPLALKVLGSALCGRKVDEWSDALARLDTNPTKGIFHILELSYDVLEEDEKDIFLDIACFFRGENEYRVKKILESCNFHPGIGIPVLIDKSLIKVEENKLGMHDLLQQMGWHIVRRQSTKEPGKRSRLWLDKDARDVVTENSGTNLVEGIYLSTPAKEDVPLKADPFLNMPKLRLLKICNVNLQLDVPFEYLSNKLRVLEWHGCPLESLPSSFQPDRLVELKMPNSRIEKLWNETLRLKLVILMDLSDCQYLIKTPDFSAVPNLEELILVGCKNLSDVHSTVWGLQHLKVANFNGCKSLESLPKSISLQSLEILTFAGCSKLNEFPEIVGNMETLSALSLSGTAIRELPTTIQCLSGLIILDLRGCKNLVGLPSVICSLTSLKFLLMAHCSRLDQLPEDIGSLENLEDLDACHTAIRKVPSSIVRLKNLKSLCFHGCKQGPRGLQLPRSFSGLSSLQQLFLLQCDLAEGEIPEDIGCLSSLQRLRLEENNFESLPESISQLSKLRELRVSKCSKLRSLPKHLQSSLEVDASNCPLLTNYPKQLNIRLSEEGISVINCENSNTAGTRYPLPIPEEQIEQFFPKFIENDINLQHRLVVRFCHAEIPHWCSHKSRGSSVAMQVSDHEVIKSLGLALFIVFEILEDDNFDENWELQQTFCTFTDDQGVAYQIDIVDFKKFLVATHVVCCYVPRVYFQYAGMLYKASRIEASVSTMRPDLEVKWCGMHLIFQQEAANFAKDLCEAYYPDDFNFGRHCKELINVKEKESSGKVMVPNEAEKVSWKFYFNIPSGENLQLLLSKLYEGPYGREKDFGLFFPHKVIPFWFLHHYAGDVALCDFPPDLFYDQRWVGLELFVMVSSGYSINVESLLDVDLCFDESSTISTSVIINTSLGSDQLVVIHIPRMRFPEQLNQCQGISALFRMTTPDMVVRMCGSRLLYEQDVEDLIRAITVCTLASEVVVDSLCQHIGQLLGSYLPEEPFDLVVETVEQNSVGGENEVGRKNDYSSSESFTICREDLIQDRGELLYSTTKQPQVFTSILHNYRSYLQQKHGFIESEKIISHPEPCFLSFLDDVVLVKECCAQKDPKPVFALHHLHVMAETRLYGSLSPEDWKRSLELLLEYFKVATLSVKGQVIAVLNPFTPSSVNNFCFPRKELLGWFRGARQTSLPRFGLKILPNLFDHDIWRGLALCAAFSVHEHPSAVLDNMGTGTFNVMCHLTSNGQCLSPAPVFSITKEKFKWLHLGGFIWLSYIPRSYLTEFKVVRDAEARIYTDCPGLMMTKWSIQPLFKQDVKEFNQAIVQCWTSFFDNLDFVRQFVEADENEQSHYTDRAETSEILMPIGDVKDFNRGLIYNATFPHCTRLMEWFSHHSREPLVEIQLPPSLPSDGNWIGLALFARFSNLENRTTSMDKVNPEIPELVCHLKTEKSSLEHLHHYGPTHEEFKWLCPTGFIWLSYIPRQWFLDQLNECDLLEASFASESRGLFAEMCGLRLVYQNDEQEFKHLCRFMNSFLENEKSERMEEHEAPEEGKQVSRVPKGDVKDFNRDLIYNATFPHCTQLMEWFGHQSRGPSMEIPLPPSLPSDGNWIGLALCARFSDLENRTSIDKVNSEIPELVCHLKTENSSLEDLHHYRSTNEEFKWLCPAGFIWLSYIPRQWFQDQLNECGLLEATFASESRGLFAELCGIRLVYQHDEQEFRHLCRFMNSLLDNEKSERLEEHEAPKKGKQILEYPTPKDESERYMPNLYLEIHDSGRP